jgi:hypothetical protein
MSEVIKVQAEPRLEVWKVIREIFRLNHLSMFAMIEDVEQGSKANEFDVILFDDVDRSKVVGLLGTLTGIRLVDRSDLA